MPRTKAKASPPRPAPGDAPQALLRRDHAGKWLAWSEDESQILAVGETAAEIRAAERAGHPRFIYDWVPPAESRQVLGLG